MTKHTIKKTTTLLLITLLFTIPTTIATTPQPTTNQNTTTNLTDTQTTQLLTHLNNTTNKSGRYLIITAGIRATSFFLKIPRLLTQRGITLLTQITYRSPLALTLIIHRHPTDGITFDYARGTHRLIVMGIGHAAFSRPHIGSFGRYIGTTTIKPILF